MESWCAKVRVPNREMFWVGHFQADGRADAKRAAIKHIAAILPLDTQIISIARGKIEITLTGPEIPFDQ